MVLTLFCPAYTDGMELQDKIIQEFLVEMRPDEFFQNGISFQITTPTDSFRCEKTTTKLVGDTVSAMIFRSAFLKFVS